MAIGTALCLIGLAVTTSYILSSGLSNLMAGYLASMRDGASRAVADECLRHQQVALHLAANPGIRALMAEAAGATLELQAAAKQTGVDEVLVVRADGRVIPELPGRSASLPSEIQAALFAALQQPATLPVMLDQFRLSMNQGIELPTPFVAACAPLNDGGGWVVVRSAADALFARLLSAARPGMTGETYVFNRHGVMLSRSRFEDELERRQLLTATDVGSSSAMRVMLRDPGNDREPIATRPLTTMAAAALTKGKGMTVTPYHDYRGQDVVGAWDWLPQHGLGIAVEMDSAEAFSAVRQLNVLYAVLIGLLTVALVAFIIWYRRAALQRARAQRAERRVRELGQYELLDQIGEGGMGRVYRARHRLLRRPTAIKLLLAEHSRAEDLARFEREANLTANLTSPHTVRIFDFGKANTGELYIVMELLTGLDLTRLVANQGPQPEARVVHWMLQACDSLAEAHAQDLIHRDLKPQNMFVSRQGLHQDVLKILDFGLAKQRKPTTAEPIESVDPNRFMTDVGRVAGTPGFMSPEQALGMPIDARTDLYALGCCLYWMLTGTQVFPYDQGQSSLYKHVHIAPDPPRKRLPSAKLSHEIDTLVMDLLAKHPGDRIQSVHDLARRLRLLPSYGQWKDHDAAMWWERCYKTEVELGQPTNPGSPSASGILVIGGS